MTSYVCVCMYLRPYAYVTKTVCDKNRTHDPHASSPTHYPLYY